MPNWCAPQVPMCWSWFYKTANAPLRKADHLSLAIAHRRHGVWLAIEPGQKNEFKVFAETVTYYSIKLYLYMK